VSVPINGGFVNTVIIQFIADVLCGVAGNHDLCQMVGWLRKQLIQSCTTTPMYGEAGTLSRNAGIKLRRMDRNRQLRCKLPLGIKTIWKPGLVSSGICLNQAR
jgi:hypothetical protein